MADAFVKYAFADFLRGNAGVSALVAGRVYPRRLPRELTLPALVIHEISEYREVTHDRAQVATTRLQIDCRAVDDLTVERLKKAVKDAALLCQKTTVSGVKIETCFFDDGGDLAGKKHVSIDEEADLDELAASLDFLVTWIPQ